MADIMIVRVHMSPEDADAFRQLAAACHLVTVRGKQAFREGSPALLIRCLVAALRQMPLSAFDIIEALIADSTRAPSPSRHARIELDVSEVDVLQSTAKKLNILWGTQQQGGQLLRQIAAAYQARPEHVTRVLVDLVGRIPNPPDLQALQEHALSKSDLKRILQRLDSDSDTVTGPGRPSRIGQLRTHALLTFFLLTGLRLNHIQALQWNHLSIDGSTVTMTNPYDADRRYVVSDPYLLATLRAYLVNAARWPMRADDSLWDSEHQSTELPFNRAQFLAALRGPSDDQTITYTTLAATYGRLIYDDTGQMDTVRKALIPLGNAITDIPLRLPLDRS